MSNSIKTVNVIEFRTFDPPEIIYHTAWEEGDAGNAAAEAYFALLVRDQKEGVTDQDVDDMVSDGYCEVGEGGFILTHSW